MKKHMVSAVLLLIMMLSLSAQAAEMRVITARRLRISLRSWKERMFPLQAV